MYLQTPCNEPNSASPISSASKARTVATLNWAAGIMEGGNRGAFEAGGKSVPGNAGVPTGNFPVVLPGGGPAGGRDRVGWVPRPGVSRLFPRYGPGSGFLPYPTFQVCRLPTVLPLQTVLSFAPEQPVSTVPIPNKAQPVSTPAKLAECDVSAATICGALRDGCVLSSQVSTEQLLACSQAGWVGNRNLFPALAARGGAQGGRYFGTLNPSPDPPADSAGMSGLVDDIATNGPLTQTTTLLALGLFSVGLWAVFQSGTKGRR